MEKILHRLLDKFFASHPLIKAPLIFLLFVNASFLLYGSFELSTRLLAAYIVFPVEEEFMFTYDENFNCEEKINDYSLPKSSKEKRIKLVCRIMKKINEDFKNRRTVSGSKFLKLGVFEEDFSKFIKGERRIHFYFSEQLSKPSPFGSKVPSFSKRISYFLWLRSYRKTAAFVGPRGFIGALFNDGSIVLGSSLNKYNSYDFNQKKIAYEDIVHEILHLCWATEDEIWWIGF